MIPKIILTVFLGLNGALMYVIVESGWCEVSKGAALASMALLVLMGCVVWIWL